MDRDEVQSMSFRIVAHVGEASSHLYEAVACARRREFDRAEAELEQGNQALIAVHREQTELLRAEVNGDEPAFSLLLVHAQDHLMTTMLLERMAREFVEVYREVNHEA